MPLKPILFLPLHQGCINSKNLIFKRINFQDNALKREIGENPIQYPLL